MALVEPASAALATIALSNAPAVRMSRGRRSSHTIPTMRRPQAAAMRGWCASGAGMDEEPGSAMPSTSVSAVIVEAVPIVMHTPSERAMPASISPQSAVLMLPARFSSQYFQISLPEPRIWPRQFPRSIGPAGMKTAGISALIAPISVAGVVLSQPPISTAPSIGCDRRFSSTSIASRLR